MLNAVIDWFRTGRRLFDLATLVVAFPLAAAGYAQISGKPWALPVHVTVSVVVLTVALWIASAKLNRVYERYDRSAILEILRPAWTLALVAMALLSVAYLVSHRGVPALVVALYFGFALVLIVGMRLGSRALSFGAHHVPGKLRHLAGIAEARSQDRPVHLGLDEEGRRAEPRSAGSFGASPAGQGVTTSSAFRAIRTCMDEVTYTAGHPNVLTMTKYTPREGDDEGHEGRRGRRRARARAAAAADAREDSAGTFHRAERGGDTVLAIAGVLDVVTVSDLQPLVEAVVAERAPSVVLELDGLRRIDSTGVSAVVSLVKRVRAFGGAVRAEGLKDQPLDVFRLLRLDLMLQL